MTYYFQRDYEEHDTLLSHEATGEDLWQWMGWLFGMRLCYLIAW